MKSCHPDLSGNDPETTNFCIFINEVYTVGSILNFLNFKLWGKCCWSFVLCFYWELTIAVQVLSDPVQRRIYDEIHGYSLTSINPFLDDSSPRDHAFVDEFSCIGNCSLIHCYLNYFYEHMMSPSLLRKKNYGSHQYFFHRETIFQQEILFVLMFSTIRSRKRRDKNVW